MSAQPPIGSKLEAVRVFVCAPVGVAVLVAFASGCSYSESTLAEVVRGEVLAAAARAVGQANGLVESGDRLSQRHLNEVTADVLAEADVPGSLTAARDTASGSAPGILFRYSTAGVSCVVRVGKRKPADQLIAVLGSPECDTGR